MLKTNCRKIPAEFTKISIFLAVLLIVFAGFSPSYIFAAENQTISFQGKIVRNDTGYEGLNVTAGNPACVVSGAGNDTCDFQTLYYDASSSGNLLGKEDFLNEEIGEFGGVFNLPLGTGSWTSGTESSFTDIFSNNDTVYIELKFAPDGSTLTETFSRMAVRASAYAIRAGRADIANEADSAFQFDSATDGTGYSPSAGMVYYDSDENILKLYNGSAWVDVAAGSSGTSLFTDSGDYTYLTSTTDSFVLGASTYTSIGSSTYSAHLTGLDSATTPFAWDNTANRLVIDGAAAQSGLTVYSNFDGVDEWPLVSFKAEHSGFASPVLEIAQDGTGSAITAYYGSSKIFEVGTQVEGAVRKATVGIGVDTADERLDINGAVHIHDFTPSTTTNRLYSVGGALYWSGAALSTGSSSLWTDGGTFSYLTSTSDDLVLGLNTVANAPFFFDVSEGAFVINGTGSGNIFTVNDELSDSSPFVIDASGNVGIGTSAPGAKLDIAGTTSTISNNSGDLTIVADESVVIKANDTSSENIMEWMNSTGGILAYINSYGKLVLSAATASNAQLNLTSSGGTDVSSPSSGDIWWNGTQLYFNDGSQNQDLLTGSGFIDGVVTSEILNGEDATAFAFNTLETYSHPTSKLFSIMNNGTEKMYLDASGNLYVAGSVISDKGFAVGLLNNTGTTIAERSLVTIDTANDSSFTTTTVANQKGAFGVVQGVNVNYDTDKDGNCDDGDTCIVAFEGVVEVNTVDAVSASKGEYISSSTTAGSAMASSDQGDGLIGVIVDTASSASGYVKMVFDEQNTVTASLYLSVDKNLYHDVYRSMADAYDAAVVAGEYDEYENVSEAIAFDTFSDSLKINSNSSTIALDTKKGRIGLWGGEKFNGTDTDTDGNTYLGSSDANDTYYYDRSQTGKQGQDSTPATLVDLGIDPYWYRGVSLETGCTHNCSQESNLSTSYNGGLFDVTGTYANGSEHGSIDVTVVGQGTSSITADIVSSDGNCTADNAVLTFGEEYSFVSGSCSGSSIKIVPQRSNYSYGDTFKINSWYIEPATANDRGSKQEFPLRSYIIASDDYVDIIDADTSKLWMRFVAGIDGSTGMIYHQNNDGYISSVEFSNGRFYVTETNTSGVSGDAKGLFVVSFFEDDNTQYFGTFGKRTKGSHISERNITTSVSSLTTAMDLVSSLTNDVSAAVVPNQPTQEVTIGGWGYIQGDDTAQIEEVVQLPYKFNSLPNIVMSGNGWQNSEPSSLKECGDWSSFDVAAVDATNLNFQAIINRDDGSNLVSGSYYCYTWTATGTVSPRTYTAVATDGGTSVINESDESVIDIYHTGYTDSNAWDDEKVWLTSEGDLYVVIHDTADNSANAVRTYYSVNAQHPNGTNLYSTVDVHYDENLPAQRGPLPNYTRIYDLYVTERTSTQDSTANTIYLGTELGLYSLQEKRELGNQNTGDDDSNGSTKIYSKDYISEEMVGDIRGMWPLNYNNTNSDNEDVSGKGNTLTAVNIDSSDAVSGVRGKAVDLDGSSEYLYRNDDDDFDYTGGEITIAAWIKSSEIPESPGYIISKESNGGSGSSGYHLYVGSSNTIGFSMPIDGTSYYAAQSSVLTPEKWQYVVGTFDGATMKLYVDGELIRSSIRPSGAGAGTTNPLTIGVMSYTESDHFNGFIDEPMITAEALTSSQIKQIYQTGKRALEGSHSTNDYKNNLSSNGTGYGTTNIAEAVGIDDNGYMYVGMNGSGSDDGWVSKIDLNSDTQVDQYTTSTDVGLVDNDVSTISVSPSGLELVGTDGVGVQSMPYDSNGNNSSGTYYSKKYTFNTNIDKGYLWMSAYKDSSDSNSNISVYASNDGGSNYVTGVLTNTSVKENIPEYEYMFDFAETGNEMIVKLVFSNSSTYHTPVYVEQWGIAHMDITTGGGNGLFTQQEDGVVDGGYVELVHGQNTYDMVVTGWVYDEDLSKWVEIKNSETTVTHSSQEDWENGNVIGSASRISVEQESLEEGSAFTYSTYVSPVIPTIGSSLYNNITWDEKLNTFGDISIQTRSGSSDKTFLDFDGTDDYIDLGNPSELQITGDQTIEMWLKPNSFGTRQNPFAKAYGGEGTIVQETDGGLNYYYGTYGGNGSPYQSFGMASDLILGEWTHIAVVRDLTNMKLYWYINGTLDNEADATYEAAVSSSLNAYIGKGYVDNYNGSIDDVRVWNTARTQTEIQNNMSSVLSGSETGLVGYWKLDSMNDTYAIDSSSSSNNGQIYGATWDGSYVWESWKPFTSGTNYLDLETADDHNDWFESNADAHEGNITRSVEFFEDENELIENNLTNAESSTDGGYIESTISSTDISGYDYITAWVRASESGNTLKIGIGESSGNEREEEITIDVADTWQKVYWDISDIVPTDRNGITKIRLTNQTASANDFYIDNVRAEKLLSDNKASKIKSTPNDYLQYRVIFATTNLSYQPVLENVTLTYSTGYRIEQTDSNTVRLYNGTGNTQKLRIDAVVGGAMIDMQGVQASVSLSPSLAQVDYQNDRSSIWINKTGSGGNFLRLQSSGVDAFVVDSDGDMTTTGDIVTEGTFSLGTSGDQGSIRYNATDDVIEFSNDGSTWLPLGAAGAKIIFSPEYAGAVLSADASSNIGSMTSDSDADSKNYYEWNSSEVSLNDYDVRVRFTLPSDFESWDTTALTLNLVTEDTGTNSKADIYLYLATSGTVDDSATSLASSSGGVWTSGSLQGADLDECNAANETCMLIIRMYSANDSYVRVGDIELNYNRSL